MIKDLFDAKQKQFESQRDEINQKITMLKNEMEKLEKKDCKEFRTAIDQLNECCLGKNECSENSADKHCPNYCPFLEVITELNWDDYDPADSINTCCPTTEVVGYKCYFPRRFADVKQERERELAQKRNYRRRLGD